MTETQLTSDAGTVQQILAPDEARVGFLITGPNAGTIELRFPGQGLTQTVALIDRAATFQQRIYTILDYGPAICGEIWAVWDITRIIRVYTYQLPLDKPNLDRLATYGKFGK